MGKNEAGTRWNRSGRGASNWLLGKGLGGSVMPGSAGFRPSEDERIEYIWKRVGQGVDDEIKPRNIQIRGVVLVGSSEVN